MMWWSVTFTPLTRAIYSLVVSSIFCSFNAVAWGAVGVVILPSTWTCHYNNIIVIVLFDLRWQSFLCQGKAHSGSPALLSMHTSPSCSARQNRLEVAQLRIRSAQLLICLSWCLTRVPGSLVRRVGREQEPWLLMPRVLVSTLLMNWLSH